MKGILLSILIAAQLFTLNAYANNDANSLIGDYDRRIYRPEGFGLKDLVFEVRIKDLVTKLNKLKSYGKLTDLYFKVYWMYPGQYKIIINGLPKGFKELRHNLKEQIKPRLSYVIPVKIMPLFRSLDLSLVKKNNKTIITAREKTKPSKTKKISLAFNNIGQLENIETFGDFIKVNSRHYHEKKSWSQGKWVMNKVVETRTQIPHVLTMDTNIEYQKINKYGFPKTLTVGSVHSFLEPKSKKIDNQKKSSMMTQFLFSNYEVNTKKAKKEIMGK